MIVELIAHMGSDLTVVNAAGVSQAKESEFETTKNSLTDGFVNFLNDEKTFATSPITKILFTIVKILEFGNYSLLLFDIR